MENHYTGKGAIAIVFKEDFKNGMKDNLPYFHTNSIRDLCIVFTEKYIPMSGSDK